MEIGIISWKKACKKGNPELRYLIINKFGDINTGYKYRVCPYEDGNYVIVEINYIGNDVKPDINIDKSRLDVIPYDDCLRGDKRNKWKQWELVNGIKRD